MGSIGRRMLKILGMGTGFLLAVVLLALGGIYIYTEDLIHTRYEVNPTPPVVVNSPEAVARGEHMVQTVGFCIECHGPDLAGNVFDDGPLVGVMVMSNLTPGKGGIGADYTDQDYVRAIRHGIGRDGESLIAMPSHMYNHLSDADLAAIIAYLRTLPPVDKELPDTTIGVIARFFLLQEDSLLPAAVIDHDAPRPPAPEPGISAEYGEYLAVACKNCHGEDLSGSLITNAGPNLTPGGALGHWSYTDFIITVRTGLTPDGRELDAGLMPYEMLSRLTDDEMKAIWMYLQSLPPVYETPPAVQAAKEKVQ